MIIYNTACIINNISSIINNQVDIMIINNDFVPWLYKIEDLIINNWTSVSMIINNQEKVMFIYNRKNT